MGHLTVDIFIVLQDAGGWEGEAGKSGRFGEDVWNLQNAQASQNGKSL
jgi:hypothetical protein